MPRTVDNAVDQAQPNRGVIAEFGLRADQTLGARLVSIARTAVGIHQMSAYLDGVRTGETPVPQLEITQSRRPA